MGGTKEDTKDSDGCPNKNKNNMNRPKRKYTKRKKNELSIKSKKQSNGNINTGLNNNSVSIKEEGLGEPTSGKRHSTIVYKKLNGLSSDTDIVENVNHALPNDGCRSSLQVSLKPNKRSLVYSATSKIATIKNEKNRQR